MGDSIQDAADYRWPAPAKLNLFLHVTGRRPDGYHTLETIFQFLDLADDITLRVRSDGRIRRTTELSDVPPEGDLVVRAARVLKSQTATPLGVDIAVVKRIPMGGGLGGGSSDAATTLIGLNHIWELGLDVEALARIGLSLGADVPVFVRGQAGFATGVGEQLTPIALEEPWYIVLYPGCSVATKEVFDAPDLTREASPIKIHSLSGDTVEGRPLSLSSLFSQTRNDCEQVVRTRYPRVDAALQWLAAFGVTRMTGTGSCIFAPFRRLEEAERVLLALSDAIEGKGRVDANGWSAFIARGRNRSPLFHERVELFWHD
uniref:4-diphosphocytidyl-2-C-methyl-D-erythritol kinase n=1 Tax=Candidatus Kentrum sp. MB TaxID=2138164 RepID=A0A451BDB1_9GAMM|nr:MAG: 4-diphosphocytidyl-2-C-methyl-D-erythritol kinase [Candidatus Kentron sp. MB]VFK33594.1 MAG: 4-diphosphocytidyl-2-C-methyl-D-erythritol kinase [Candidatus Kentron sp. MB]VFK76273.1 MAG: 4-diphosphocytidyl-2-C-methyl-D-erythritol kinase [Candidatus Kentron sp. MB]